MGTGRKHALLSASGASRWLNCTPSPRLEEKMPKPAESDYAAEGTLAHDFGELRLRAFIEGMTTRKLNTQLKKLRANKLYTAEMEGEVAKYVSYVSEEYMQRAKESDGAVLLVEEKIDLTHYIEDGFGRNDAVIIADGVLEVCDLKYGKGIRVDAEDNPQLKLYGLGALREHELSFDIHTVKMTIIQPRLDHIDSWSISAADLQKWGEGEVKAKAKKAYAGEGIQKAGSWCKWCKVKPVCATLAAQNVKLAQHEFKSPHLLTEEQLLEVYKQQAVLVDWANSVQAYMLSEAVAGKKWNGLKLVEGRSNRKLVDQKKAAELLLEAGYKADKFMTSKMVGITALEKLVGKKEFYPLLGDIVDKPKGKPTLVDEKDKRPEYVDDSAQDDFS